MAGLKSKKTSPRRTICEVHREIYDELIEIGGTEKARNLLEEAFLMGKRMFSKLISYKPEEDIKFYRKNMNLPLNHNYEESTKKRGTRPGK